MAASWKRDAYESTGCRYFRLAPCAQMPFRADPLAARTDLYDTNLQHNTYLSHSADLSYKTGLS